MISPPPPPPPLKPKLFTLGVSLPSVVPRLQFSSTQSRSPPSQPQPALSGDSTPIESDVSIQASPIRRSNKGIFVGSPTHWLAQEHYRLAKIIAIEKLKTILKLTDSRSAVTTAFSAVKSHMHLQRDVETRERLGVIIEQRHCEVSDWEEDMVQLKENNEREKEQLLQTNKEAMQLLRDENDRRIAEMDRRLKDLTRLLKSNESTNKQLLLGSTEAMQLLRQDKDRHILELELRLQDLAQGKEAKEREKEQLTETNKEAMQLLRQDKDRRIAELELRLQDMAQLKETKQREKEQLLVTTTEEMQQLRQDKDRRIEELEQRLQDMARSKETNEREKEQQLLTSAENVQLLKQEKDRRIEELEQRLQDMARSKETNEREKEHLSTSTEEVQLLTEEKDRRIEELEQRLQVMTKSNETNEREKEQLRRDKDRRIDELENDLQDMAQLKDTKERRELFVTSNGKKEVLREDKWQQVEDLEVRFLGLPKKGKEQRPTALISRQTEHELMIEVNAAVRQRKVELIVARRKSRVMNCMMLQWLRATQAKHVAALQGKIVAAQNETRLALRQHSFTRRQLSRTSQECDEIKKAVWNAWTTQATANDRRIKRLMRGLARLLEGPQNIETNSEAFFESLVRHYHRVMREAAKPT